MDVDEGEEVPLLAKLTWREAAAWFRRDPRLLLPIGNCAQHGPHLPLGTDTVIVTRLAADLARTCGVLVAPTFPYASVSVREQEYAGTASLEARTLHAVLNELVAAWERQGLAEVIFLTAHGYAPHVRAMAAVVTERVRVRAVDVHAIDLDSLLDSPDPVEHAGELATSLILHLAPELVRSELIADAPAVNGARRGSAEADPPPGSAGVVGYPSFASAEKGRQIYDFLLSYVGQRLMQNV